MPVIEVSHLTKEYRLGALKGFKQTMLNAGNRLLGRPVQERPMFKALDDVSFSIEQGDVVGVIGHNGAGKSTLLKMLARISTPTSGSLQVSGRISPLIEVGAGFVPNFSGRENVYLNGSILGLSKKEIDKKFDEIVDFSEMAQFIDTPVKRYSSGMQVKLAFAVATSIESQILLVDEVLAVGDLAFQQKCIEKVEELIRKEQRTVLIVGHNIRQIQRICDRVILLNSGKIVEDGLPQDVCGRFFREALESTMTRHQQKNAGILPEKDSGDIRVHDIRFIDKNGKYTNEVKVHEPLSIEVKFDCLKDLSAVEIVVGFQTPDFVHIISVNNVLSDSRPDLFRGAHCVCCRFDDIPLRPLTYSLRIGFLDKYRQTLWYGENLSKIAVMPGDYDAAYFPELGLVHLPCDWRFDT